ncbi:MAG: arylformamidase [Capsulimonadales bacterium]|nr:arylformamidase [Capsulimonadales bacterium]
MTDPVMPIPHFYDITIPMRSGVAVWPGDTPFAFHLSWKMADGDTVNVGAVTMSVHTGTHADAPFHFEAHGARIGEVDLNPYFGPAIVVDVTGQTPIDVSAFVAIDFVATPRVLLRTNAWTDHTRFPESVPTLTPEAVAFLGQAGAILLGLDLPSVDAIDSRELPLHHALNRAGIRILESLDLSSVPPGPYELIALPLKLTEADGSPVRALLRSLPGKSE